MSGDAKSAAGEAAPKPGAAYTVLARKYRPQTFDSLVGQDAMVRTLTNAFAQNRIAHAFMLTGVRGVGKTTTARIIARALNCVGPDGKRKEPAIAPCGVCEPCLAIAESRHIDVFEMDAASRTGIDDVREIVEAVRYMPVSARYKVYIVDEVHMLSKPAFNGLLKTLEEPPPHVKFVFATTEIRKVPVTVLSRCQRFDLRRIAAAQLVAHLEKICAAESIEAEPGALALVARAAEGSVRDALSLLDQAIADHEKGKGAIAEERVRAMLGLAGRARIVDLFDHVMKGDARAALAELDSQYDSGADPLVVVQDLLDFTHLLTRLKLVPEAARSLGITETEARRGRAMAEALTLPALARAWQILLKGVAEIRDSANAIAAAEMVLVRLIYASELPPPEKLARDAAAQGVSAPAPLSAPSSPSRAPRAEAVAAPRTALAQKAEPAREPIASFDALVARAGAEREARLKGDLERYVHLVRFEPLRIELRLAAGAPAALVSDLQDRLKRWTGERWVVTLAKDGGAPTLEEQAREEREAKHASVRDDPLVQAALKTFPNARIVAVREPQLPDGDASDRGS